MLLVLSSTTFLFALFGAAFSHFHLPKTMEFGSYEKSYAEAVTGSTSLVSSSWSHLQTQDEEEAIVLAVQNSLSIQVVYISFLKLISNRYSFHYILFAKFSPNLSSC